MSKAPALPLQRVGSGVDVEGEDQLRQALFRGMAASHQHAQPLQPIRAAATVTKSPQQKQAPPPFTPTATSMLPHEIYAFATKSGTTCPFDPLCRAIYGVTRKLQSDVRALTSKQIVARVRKALPESARENEPLVRGVANLCRGDTNACRDPQSAIFSHYIKYDVAKRAIERTRAAHVRSARSSSSSSSSRSSSSSSPVVVSECAAGATHPEFMMPNEILDAFAAGDKLNDVILPVLSNTSAWAVHKNISNRESSSVEEKITRHNAAFFRAHPRLVKGMCKMILNDAVVCGAPGGEHFFKHLHGDARKRMGMVVAARQLVKQKRVRELAAAKEKAERANRLARQQAAQRRARDEREAVEKEAARAQAKRVRLHTAQREQQEAARRLQIQALETRIANAKAELDDARSEASTLTTNARRAAEAIKEKARLETRNTRLQRIADEERHRQQMAAIKKRCNEECKRMRAEAAALESAAAAKLNAAKKAAADMQRETAETQRLADEAAARAAKAKTKVQREMDEIAKTRRSAAEAAAKALAAKDKADALLKEAERERSAAVASTVAAARVADKARADAEAAAKARVDAEAATKAEAVAIKVKAREEAEAAAKAEVAAIKLKAHKEAELQAAVVLDTARAQVASIAQQLKVLSTSSTRDKATSRMSGSNYWRVRAAVDDAEHVPDDPTNAAGKRRHLAAFRAMFGLRNVSCDERGVSVADIDAYLNHPSRVHEMAGLFVNHHSLMQTIRRSLMDAVKADPDHIVCSRGGKGNNTYFKLTATGVEFVRDMIFGKHGGCAATAATLSPPPAPAFDPAAAAGPQLLLFRGGPLRSTFDSDDDEDDPPAPAPAADDEAAVTNDEEDDDLPAPAADDVVAVTNDEEDDLPDDVVADNEEEPAPAADAPAADAPAADAGEPAPATDDEDDDAEVTMVTGADGLQVRLPAYYRAAFDIAMDQPDAKLTVAEIGSVKVAMIDYNFTDGRSTTDEHNLGEAITNALPVITSKTTRAGLWEAVKATMKPARLKWVNERLNARRFGILRGIQRQEFFDDTTFMNTGGAKKSFGFSTMGCFLIDNSAYSKSIVHFFFHDGQVPANTVHMRCLACGHHCLARASAVSSQGTYCQTCDRKHYAWVPSSDTTTVPEKKECGHCSMVIGVRPNTSRGAHFCPNGCRSHGAWNDVEGDQYVVGKLAPKEDEDKSDEGESDDESESDDEGESDDDDDEDYEGEELAVSFSVTGRKRLASLRSHTKTKASAMSAAGGGAGGGCDKKKARR